METPISELFGHFDDIQAIMPTSPGKITPLPEITGFLQGFKDTSGGFFPNKYTLDFIDNTVREFLVSDSTITEVAKRKNIPRPTLSGWIKRRKQHVDKT